MMALELKEKLPNILMYRYCIEYKLELYILTTENYLFDQDPAKALPEPALFRTREKITTNWIEKQRRRNRRESYGVN